MVATGFAIKRKSKKNKPFKMVLERLRKNLCSCLEVLPVTGVTASKESSSLFQLCPQHAI